jgi:cobalt-zinc-cadmium efflux system outer membrane protein
MKQGIHCPSDGAAVWLFIGVIGLSSGCASYRSRPLNERPALVSDPVPLLTEAMKHLPKDAQRHRFDPSNGLDLTEIATLAVVNNPDLMAQRAKLGIADAQVFSAQLVPDPQIATSLDRPMGSPTGLVDAWGLGLSYDIIPLVTRRARIEAEQKGQTQVRLDLLWSEWQTVQQARSLVVRSQLEQRRLRLLEEMLALYKKRYERSSKGLSEGNVTLEVNGTDLTAVLDTMSQINQLEQTHSETRHNLDLVLGLQPDVAVRLAPLPPAKPIDKERIARQLDVLPDVRPDLLALKAGYQSQEARVRAAILAQFPSLSIGFNRARDTSDVNTAGFGVTLTLPLFDANRGAIATERATREQLAKEFQARLAQASVDASRVVSLQGIIRRQQSNLATYLPRLKILVDRAKKAYEDSEIDALTFLNMEMTWMNKRLEQLDLMQSAWENRLALQTMLALPLQEGKDR